MVSIASLRVFALGNVSYRHFRELVPHSLGYSGIPHCHPSLSKFVIRCFVATCELSFAMEQAAKGLIQVLGRTCAAGAGGWPNPPSLHLFWIKAKKTTTPSVAKPPAAPGLLRRRRRDGGIASPQVQGAVLAL